MVHIDCLSNAVTRLRRLFTPGGKQCLLFKVLPARAERTHALFVYCMCGCAWCPFICCTALHEPCAVTFKENCIVLFMEDDSINRGVLILCEREGSRTTGFTSSRTCVTCTILFRHINTALCHALNRAVGTGSSEKNRGMGNVRRRGVGEEIREGNYKVSECGSSLK